MSEQESKKLIKSMKKQAAKIKSSKANALSFLVDAGILNQKGNFTAPYRELGKACTAPTQD